MPSGPSEVSIVGTQLLVSRRLPDGTLAPAVPYTIQGVTWSPATQAPSEGPNPLNPATQTQYGFFFDYPGRNPQGHDILSYWLRREPLAHYQTDIPLMAQMNVNTVRLYGDFGDDLVSYQKILDTFYENGIMVIMAVSGSKADIDNQHYLQVLQLCKNHPAILMWSFGNEWNFTNFFGYGAMSQAISAVNQAAGAVKSADSHHPVTSILGDKFKLNGPSCGGTDNPNSDIPSIVPNIPNVDIWGLNVYRGASFGLLFNQWKNVTTKPFYLSEFGTDSFRTTQYVQPFPPCTPQSGEAQVQTGFEDQTMQATFDAGLWQEIAMNTSETQPAHNCVGGLLHEFNDEIWKVGNFNVGLGNLVNYGSDTSYNTYNPDGFVILGSHPDGISNEEYFGMVDATRSPKQVYQTMKALFVPHVNPPPNPDTTPSPVGASPGSVRIRPNPFRGARGDTAIVFDQLAPNSTVKIFTVSGRWIKTLLTSTDSVSWNLLNDSGDPVASGLYLALVTDNLGTKSRQTVVIIR